MTWGNEKSPVILGFLRLSDFWDKAAKPRWGPRSLLKIWLIWSLPKLSFFLAPSRVLPFLYFPVPVVTFLLKTYPEAHPLDVNSLMYQFLFQLTLSPMCFVATITQMLHEAIWSIKCAVEMTQVSRTTPSTLDLIDDILAVIFLNTLFCKVP